MEERRKFIRFNSPFCVECKKENVSFQGVIKDISYGGTRLILDTKIKFSLGDNFLVNIFFPEKNLVISSRVVWEKDFLEKKEIGLVFQNLSNKDKEFLYQSIFKYFSQEFTRRWWNF